MVEAGINAQHCMRLVVCDKGLARAEVAPPFLDWQDRQFPTYSDPANTHHWQFTYVWHEIMPYLAQQFGIPFDTSDFIEVEGPSPEYCHHQWREDFECTAHRLLTGQDICHTYRECCQGGGLSPYHSIICLPHESALYTTGSPKMPGRRLLVNSDSMSIPLIPLLLPYYGQVLYLDFRSAVPQAARQAVDSFQCTDYLCLLIGGSYRSRKHHRNLAPHLQAPPRRQKALDFIHGLRISSRRQ